MGYFLNNLVTADVKNVRALLAVRNSLDRKVFLVRGPTEKILLKNHFEVLCIPAQRGAKEILGVMKQTEIKISIICPIFAHTQFNSHFPCFWINFPSYKPVD